MKLQIKVGEHRMAPRYLMYGRYIDGLVAGEVLQLNYHYHSLNLTF